MWELCRWTWRFSRGWDKEWVTRAIECSLQSSVVSGKRHQPRDRVNSKSISLLWRGEKSQVRWSNPFVSWIDWQVSESSAETTQWTNGGSKLCWWYHNFPKAFVRLDKPSSVALRQPWNATPSVQAAEYGQGTIASPVSSSNIKPTPSRGAPWLNLR